MKNLYTSPELIESKELTFQELKQHIEKRLATLEEDLGYNYPDECSDQIVKLFNNVQSFDRDIIIDLKRILKLMNLINFS